MVCAISGQNVITWLDYTLEIHPMDDTSHGTLAELTVN